MALDSKRHRLPDLDREVATGDVEMYVTSCFFRQIPMENHMSQDLNGYINPYYWVDDHPLLYGNNGSLDPGTHGT